MNELESLALLIADLNKQVRSLQSENAELQKLVELYSDANSSEPVPPPEVGL